MTTIYPRARPKTNIVKLKSVLPRDSIPSIDDPDFNHAYIGDSDNEVIVVEGNPPRAYPIRLLSYHEIVNDVVNDRPIAATWCPICWSAAVYEREVKGHALTFGVSGKLADDALVMYDRETESEWKQPTGTAIAGELKDTQLTALPASILTWDRFTAEHPDGVVLQPVHGTETDRSPSPSEIYDLSPYEKYEVSEEFGLYGMRGEGEPRSWDRDDIDAKTLVLGIELGGEAMGYPVSRINDAGGIVTDTIGDRDIIVVTTAEGIHAYEDPGFAFTIKDGQIVGDGTTWDGDTGKSSDGRQLVPIPTRRMFAFAWQDAHGSDAFFL